MLRQFFILTVFLVALLQSPASVATTPSFSETVKPVLEKFCYNCHGEDVQKAGLSLHQFVNEADALKDPAVWKKVLENVRIREMPPSNKPQPSDAEREGITHWIEQRLLVTDCSKPDPGRVTIRRLNRAEYNNTIRDLLGISDFHPADDFPADDTGYGFDNIGDVLSVPPVLLEKYLAAAEKAINEAIITDPHTNGPTIRISGSNLKATGQVEAAKYGGLKMMREGALTTNMHFKGGGGAITLFLFGRGAIRQGTSRQSFNCHLTERSWKHLRSKRDIAGRKQ